jgi:hypothetical protein
MAVGTGAAAHAQRPWRAGERALLAAGTVLRSASSCGAVNQRLDPSTQAPKLLQLDACLPAALKLAPPRPARPQRSNMRPRFGSRSGSRFTVLQLTGYSAQLCSASVMAVPATHSCAANTTFCTFILSKMS